jgi:cell division protein FtsL
LYKELRGEISNFILHAVRRQKEEALNFRAKKENEVSAVEKVRILAHMVVVVMFALLL